jgi:hypothetical protein
MSGHAPDAGDSFPLSSSRLGGGPIQARGLKAEGLGRLYLTGFAPPGQCRVIPTREFSDSDVI